MCKSRECWDVDSRRTDGMCSRDMQGWVMHLSATQAKSEAKVLLQGRGEGGCSQLKVFAFQLHHCSVALFSCLGLLSDASIPI